MRLAVAVAVCAIAATACGGGSSSGPPGDTSSAASRLVLTRADGSTLVVDDLRVSCGEDSAQGGKTAVIVTSPSAAGGPSVRFEGILDDVAHGATFALPYEGAALYQHPKGALIFVADRATGNEASSAEEDASGRLHVSSAACDPQPSIRFSVDGVLGSEYGDGEPVRIEGEVALPR